VGAQAVALYDADGRLLGVHGTPPGDPAPGEISGWKDRPPSAERVELDFPNGTLIVCANAYTPYFGRDELELLRSLGVMTSQALERCRLLDRERTTLEALEEAQRIARLGSWHWVLATNRIEWSNELYRIHQVDPATFTPSIEALEDMCHPDDREARGAAIRRAADAGTTFGVEYRIIHHDGQVRSLSGLGKIIRNERGEPVEMIGTVQDVTEQRRLEDLRTEFIANAAHELRTPLTTLAGMAMLLASHRHDLPEDTAEQAFEALGRQGERARVLINNMLDLSQLEARRFPIHMEEVTLAEVVAHAQEVVAQPDGKDVAVDVAECVRAFADPARLEQVVTNLLSNAYRYGGSHIRIEASRTGSRVLLAVTDDGPGVSGDLIDTMFDPFTRGADVTGKVGSGLGLAISRRLVEAFEGSMTYEGRQPHGSRFVVELKAAA
jgi:signal transduction histidine kinase